MTSTASEFDFAEGSRTAQPQPHVAVRTGGETAWERRLRMLVPLSQACVACSMCELGMAGAQRGRLTRDPHVFSNLQPHRFMIVGQGPGWEELGAGRPFSGAAGQNLAAALAARQFGLDDFYVTNAVRCWVPNNGRPDARQSARCRPFLEMEAALLKPKLALALGTAAFAALCPDADFAGGLRQLTRSPLGMPVMAAHHPSPLCLCDAGIKAEFAAQVALFCDLVIRLR